MFPPRPGTRTRPLKRYPGTHRAVETLLDLLETHGITFVELEARSGVSKNAIRQWRGQASPSIHLLEYCLNVFDMELVAVPRNRPAE